MEQKHESVIIKFDFPGEQTVGEITKVVGLVAAKYMVPIIDALDLDILGFIDHNITINIIKDEQIVAKKQLKLPKQITNVIKCKNPRCITSIEQGLDQIFVLTAEEEQTYRCKYCEEKYRRH